jgi:hypothetical protein
VFETHSLSAECFRFVLSRTRPPRKKTTSGTPRGAPSQSSPPRSMLLTDSFRLNQTGRACCTNRCEATTTANISDFKMFFFFLFWATGWASHADSVQCASTILNDHFVIIYLLSSCGSRHRSVCYWIINFFRIKRAWEYDVWNQCREQGTSQAQGGSQSPSLNDKCTRGRIPTCCVWMCLSWNTRVVMRLKYKLKKSKESKTTRTDIEFNLGR